MTITSRVAERNGWVWPIADRAAWPWLTRQEPDVPQWVMSHVTGRRGIIQAGGNCGLYTAEYAEHFERVFTWEPDAVNFYCLVSNTPSGNVYAHRAALGSAPGRAGLVIDEANCGAYHVSQRPGSIPVVTIDSYGLDDIDLIHLDMEGYEGEALTGAAETIARCRPVIACEVASHGDKFGWPRARLAALIEGYGYREAGRHHHEVLWQPI